MALPVNGTVALTMNPDIGVLIIQFVTAEARASGRRIGLDADTLVQETFFIQFAQDPPK